MEAREYVVYAGLYLLTRLLYVLIRKGWPAEDRRCVEQPVGSVYQFCRGTFTRLVAVHRRPARTLVVLGSGGHTTEILSLCRAMDVSRYIPATFVVADTDHLSQARAEDTLLNTAWAGHRDHCRFWRVPRAREVGQSWLSTTASTAVACVHAFGIVTTVRPELILVNGPVRTYRCSFLHHLIVRNHVSAYWVSRHRRGRAFHFALRRCAWRFLDC